LLEVAIGEIHVGINMASKKLENIWIFIPFTSKINRIFYYTHQSNLQITNFVFLIDYPIKVLLKPFNPLIHFKA